jgi:Kef-type K+ transport system membrane component KefB
MISIREYRKRMKKKYRENVIKNVLILGLLVILYFPIYSQILQSGLAHDKTSAGNILIAASIMAVLAAFGNFAFKYDKVDLENTFKRYFGHFVTGILMFVMGVSMIITMILIDLIMGSFILLDITVVLLYLACVGYDFWDLISVAKISE